MAAIGFTPQLNEIDELRKAYDAMNDVSRNIKNVRECLRREDFRMADHHLRAADWHLGQAKQRIAAVGRQSQVVKVERINAPEQAILPPLGESLLALVGLRFQTISDS